MIEQSVPNTFPDLLTEVQVAALTRRSRNALQADRRHARGLPYFKLGRRIFYSRQDVVAWLDANRIGGTMPATRMVG